MPATQTALFAAIAQRAARDDIDQARQALLRLRHEWKALAPEIDAETNTLLDGLDGLAHRIAVACLEPAA